MRIVPVLRIDLAIGGQEMPRLRIYRAVGERQRQ